MREDSFGKTRDGRPSYLYTLSNRSGLEVVLCDYGATIVSIRVPDRDGHPTEEFLDVRNSPFDFTRLTPIGARIDADDPQLVLGGGYDHNWVLTRDSGEAEIPAAQLCDPASGRRLEIFTTQPGIQFYSGNSLDGSVRGKNGAPCTPRCALCLEPQHFPDSPNQPNFPSVVLRQGERFRSATTYRFSCDRDRV
jgi:aldose 1-epimerase